MVAMGLLAIAVEIKYNWVKTDTETNTSVFQAGRQLNVTFNLQHLKIDVELIFFYRLIWCVSHERLQRNSVTTYCTTAALCRNTVIQYNGQFFAV